MPSATKDSSELTSKEKLWESWSYEFAEWIKTMQSAPIELVKSVDYSQSYEMDRGHIFKLENKSYAVVIESGCSCYSCSDAKIELFGKKSDAEKSLQKYIDQQEQYKRDYA